MAFGLDETVMNPSRSHTRRRYVTVFVDLDRHRVIDVVEGRHAAAVTGWLQHQDPVWRAQVATVALDPHAGYRTAVTDPHVGFDNAELVADCFHVVKLANAAIDDVRRRVQQETLGHRGHKHDPLYRIRRALLAGIERLDPDALSRIRAALAAGTRTTRSGAPGPPRNSSGPCSPPATPSSPPDGSSSSTTGSRWSRSPSSSGWRPPLSRWQDEILAYHHTGGVSSARVEAINLDVKNIKRVARGFTNFDNYRARILSRLGQTWQAPTTARLRGPNALTLAA